MREKIFEGCLGRENYFGDVKIVDGEHPPTGRMKVEDEPQPSHPYPYCVGLCVWQMGRMRSGITRRWLWGNLPITVLLVLLVETMFLYNYTRSYYNSVQTIMYCLRCPAS